MMFKKNNYDVGLKEDLIYTLKNLCAIEDHAKSSFYKTKERKWLELNRVIREMRSKWLERIFKKDNSENWCISKHLLNSMMGMQEVANRLYGSEDGKEAEDDSGLLMGAFLILNDINIKKEVEDVQ